MSQIAIIKRILPGKARPQGWPRDYRASSSPGSFFAWRRKAVSLWLMMSKSDIILEVQNNLGQFAEWFDAFCQKVEDYAGTLYQSIWEAEEKYKKEWPEVEKERKAAIKLAKESLKIAIAEGRGTDEVHSLQKQTDLAYYSPQANAKRTDPPPTGCIWTTRDDAGIQEYVDLSERFDPQEGPHATRDLYTLFNPFWRLGDLLNPVTWFDVIKHARSVELCDEDKLLHDAVILSVSHDLGSGLVKSASRVFHTREYQGRFRRDDFARDLWAILKDDDGTNLKTAWNGVKGYLSPAGSPPQAEVDTDRLGRNVPEWKQYEHFLEETRDAVAGWIGNDRTKALLSDDMQNLQSSYQAYKDAIDAHVKKRDAYFESPKGKAQLRKNARWKKKWNTYKQHSGPESEAPQHPGPPPAGGYKTELPIGPLVKFWLRVKPDSLKIGDYRCLLGALHDGVTWDRGDKAFYICSDLRKEDTIVDVLYWQGICKRSDYRPLIEEALREVEKDLRKRGLLMNAVRPTVTAVEENKPASFVASETAADQLDGTSAESELTDTESNILEALGDQTMTGPKLFKKAGYSNTSHYRGTLSGLVKRQILEKRTLKDHAEKGYRKTRPVSST